MCRYDFSHYKDHFACFRCRRVWRVERRQNGKPDVIPCRLCGHEAANVGKDFKAPRATDRRSWRAAEILIAGGLDFDSCGCGGPGYRPRAPREARKEVNRFRQAPRGPGAALLVRWQSFSILRQQP